jgi:hypothetical protein
MNSRLFPYSGARFVLLLPLLLMAGSLTTFGQTYRVEINLPAFDYDVIYFTDFIDIASQKLASNIPNFSGDVRTNPSGGNILIYLTADAYIQLKGKSKLLLAHVETKDLTLSSRDLQRGSTGAISLKDGSAGYSEGPGRKELEDAISNSGITTVPVGTFSLVVKSFLNGTPSSGADIGATTRDIVVRNSSPDEVQVNLIDPQPGATVATTLPTFSWNSPNPKVTLYVFEKLPIHRSPQEAITGIPHLKKELVGVSTYTYPPDASRRLEQNKSYYWYVETDVTTNRSTEKRKSEPWLFRIRTEDPLARAIERLLGNLGSNVSGTYSTLQAMGWIPNKITLDGKVLTAEELTALANQLNEQSVQSVRAE